MVARMKSQAKHGPRQPALPAARGVSLQCGWNRETVRAEIALGLLGLVGLAGIGGIAAVLLAGGTVKDVSDYANKLTGSLQQMLAIAVGFYFASRGLGPQRVGTDDERLSRQRAQWHHRSARAVGRKRRTHK